MRRERPESVKSAILEFVRRLDAHTVALVDDWPAGKPLIQ
jgi:hypothetical protein